MIAYQFSNQYHEHALYLILTLLNHLLLNLLSKSSDKLIFSYIILPPISTEDPFSYIFYSPYKSICSQNGIVYVLIVNFYLKCNRVFCPKRNPASMSEVSHQIKGINWRVHVWGLHIQLCSAPLPSFKTNIEPIVWWTTDQYMHLLAVTLYTNYLVLLIVIALCWVIYQRIMRHLSILYGWLTCFTCFRLGQWNPSCRHTILNHLYINKNRNYAFDLENKGYGQEWNSRSNFTSMNS